MLSRFILHRLAGSNDPFRSPYNGGGKDSGSSAPDYSQVAAANAHAADMAYKSAQEDLAFRKQTYADQKPLLDRVASASADVMDQQIASAKANADRSAQQWQDYENTYRPNERQAMMDAYGSRYLTDDEKGQLADIFAGKGVAGGSLAAPTQYDDSAYTALQQKIKAGGGGALSTDEVSELAGLMGRTAPVDPSTQPSTDPNAIPWYVDPESGSYLGGGVTGALMRQSAAGKQADATAKYQSDLDAYNTGKSRMEELLQKQAAGPGAYQLTDDDKAVLSKYGTDKAAYDKSLADYNTEQDSLKTKALDNITQTSAERAADQAATRASADVNSATAQQNRALARVGGDPSKMAAYATQIGNNAALAKVGAGNAAREGAFSTGIGLRSGMANFGRNMPNTAGQQSMISTQAGSAGINTGTTGANSSLPGAQFVAGGYGGMMNAAQLQQQGNLGLANIMSGDYRAGLQSDAAGSAGMGSMIGGMASAAAVML